MAYNYGVNKNNTKVDYTVWGLKSKETFRRHYLHPAIKLNLIRMTIPDKPNSKNQRYIKS
jgi:hypothetical protein